MNDTRRPLDGLAAGTMLALTMAWGLQQVAVKVAAPSIPLLAQATIRSAFAMTLVIAWSHWRAIPLLDRREFGPGILAGLLFAGEFAFIYLGLGRTTAARMVVLLYVAPAMTALGAALFVPGERLSARQWAGVAVAFAGTAFAFADGFGAPDRPTLVGDAMALVAALLWSATTVMIRTTTLARAAPARVLNYQLAVSAVVLGAVSLAIGESWTFTPAPIAWASLFYQTVCVAFAHLLLGETIGGRFAAAAVLVAAGIALVNAGAPARKPPP